MNILHLKYAVEVAKTGSVNKAAENMFVGQPNLSRAIKDLEEDLGITVFMRSPKGMEITPEGEEFLQYAKKILKQIDEVEGLYKGGIQRKKHFSISVPRACYIGEAFAEFSKTVHEDENAELFYKETNALRAIKNIMESDYTLGIIRYASQYDRYFKQMLDEKGLNYELVTEFSYQLLMSKKHSLAQKDEILFSDLKPYVEIAHADPFVPSLSLSEIRKEELPNDTNRRIFVFERASQFELLSENHEAFIWVSPVPEKTLERYGLCMRKCPDNTKVYKDVLIYKKDYKLTEMDKAFITQLCVSKREHIG